MAIYELECKKCNEQYDLMCQMCDREKKIKNAKCPSCGSKSKETVISECSFAFTQPVGTDRFNNSHDYRHNWNVNRAGGVKDQRKFAENNSHMGNDPYPEIDDITDGKSFGEPIQNEENIKLM